ncbi:MAG: protein kinase [Clostridiales bacterium]|nr:protein kinase [Clostridiales bacterium]
MKDDRGDAFRETLQAACGDQQYPEDFLAKFEPFECFSHNETCETLLVKQRETGLFYVAKCYVKTDAPFRTLEAVILQSLDHRGLPRFVGEFENENYLCVVREYVEGMPLDRFVARCKPTQEKAVEWALSLCDILAYLHGRVPPVIHRDIKPQNLIVDPQGELWLIDFGISRLFDPSKAEDTVSCGTKNFSSPEQYGYAQTDARADLFSMGILLGWLLTGECKRELILPGIANRRLRHIVEKCTAFAPRDRYATAARVRAGLLALDGRRQRRILGWSCAVLACLLCLGIGFCLGRYAESAGFLRAPEAVVFREPLVEQAVRMTLGLFPEEPLREKDLLSVTELFIYGDQPLPDPESFNALCDKRARKEAPSPNGGMTSLEDMKKLKNLSILFVAGEDIADLSPLTGLVALRILDLRHNPVSDITPLGSLPYLAEVCLYGTRVADLSPLAGCPVLTHIDAGKTFITSLESLQGLDGLKSLRLSGAPLHTLRGVGELGSLERLSLTEVTDGDLTPMLGNPALKEVELGEALRPATQEQLDEAPFQVIYR